MWKGRPVVASSIGGIKDQIEHEKTGLLLADPTDLKAFGDAVSRLLSKPDDAAAMGKAGQERVRQSFLSDRHLKQYAELFARLDS
jgi:trehalose synthase